MGPENAPKVARVVVDVPARALSEPFDYSVPVDLASTALVGAPVLVPLGSRRVVGHIVGVDFSEAHRPGLKPLESVLGPPSFGDHAFGLARWIAEEYVSPLADAMRLFLPPGGAPRVEAVLVAAGPRPDDPQSAEAWDLASTAGGVTPAQVRAAGPGLAWTAERAVASGALRRSWRPARPSVGAVDDRWAEIVAESGFEPRAIATSQRALLDALSRGPVRVVELFAELGAVDGALRRLSEAGAVKITLRRRMRFSLPPSRPDSRPMELSDGQSEALAAIAEAGPGETVLIDGVTGSGKTEVYLRAIEQVLTHRLGAIVLVPEIALTPQTVGRFRARFGEAVAVLHSRLAAGERFDQWDRVRAGDARVVVGPRSALFAPMRGLGLVVMDEEHDSSYKQGSAPRYHARAVAERLCAASGAVLVLGSATPSMETRAASEAGRFTRVIMPQRVGGGRMPYVDVVDMTAEFAAGHRSMFSRPLIAALESVRDRRTKAMLLLNRRGFASFLLCRECGFVPRCDRCSVALTYHETGERLVCHHCGAVRPVPPRCPRCGSPYLRLFGAGTQRVESELAAAVPGLPSVRMDADTTRGKGGHERRLAEFEALTSGVLLGTQMIAKGLDYPEVDLVGVINADTTLQMPDFRAAERTFQMVEQVGGRAGRGEVAGRVIVQTYWPEHPAIAAAAAHDGEAFFRQESRLRGELHYPPAGRLARVVVSGPNAAAVRKAAETLAEALREIGRGAAVAVLGPSPAPLARIKGRSRWHVLVKGAVDAPLPAVITDALLAVGVVEGVSFAPDVDPVDMM
jgi:primosomal protein N' (replication factor Y)